MCEVSDKLKLCTCSSDIEELDNYWVLHRFEKDRWVIIMGETMPPSEIDLKVDLKNKELLAKLINEPDVFDKTIKPKEKDRLSINFKCSEEYMTYGFEFQKERWVEIGYDFLGEAKGIKNLKVGK